MQQSIKRAWYALPSLVRFILRRLAIGVLLCVGVTLVSFTLTQIVPGDPAWMMLGPDNTLWLATQWQIEGTFPALYRSLDGLDWREITLPELKAVLAGNWEGHETLRARILRRAPRYGNGLAWVPAIDAARAIAREDGVQHRLHAVASVLEPQRLQAGRQHRHRLAAAGAELGHEPGNGLRRRADDGQVGGLGQLVHGLVGLLPGDRDVPQVDRPDRPGEPAGQHVADDRRADAVGRVRGPDHGHRARTQQEVQVADAHVGFASATSFPGLDQRLRSRGPD